MQSAVQTEGADRAAAASARQAEQMAWTCGDRASRRKTGRTPKIKKNEIKRHLFNIAVTVGATVLGIIGTEASNYWDSFGIGCKERKTFIATRKAIQTLVDLHRSRLM